MDNLDFRNVRKTLGLTQVELAEKLQISVVYVKKLESGSVPVTSEIMERIYLLIVRDFPSLGWFAGTFAEIEKILDDAQLFG